MVPILNWFLYSIAKGVRLWDSTIKSYWLSWHLFRYLYRRKFFTTRHARLRMGKPWQTLKAGWKTGDLLRKALVKTTKFAYSPGMLHQRMGCYRTLPSKVDHQRSARMQRRGNGGTAMRKLRSPTCNFKASPIVEPIQFTLPLNKSAKKFRQDRSVVVRRYSATIQLLTVADPG